MAHRGMRNAYACIFGVFIALVTSSCDPFELVDPGGATRYRVQPNHPSGGMPRQGPPPEGTGLEQPRPDPGNVPVPQRYPTAERTENPNRVISPYAPFNVIDITGYSSGQLVRDPTNNEIFRIP